MIAAWLMACAYRVTLVSTPEPIEVRLPDGTIVGTPTEVRLRWAPFQRQELVATSPGFRALTLDLRRDEVRWTHWLRARSKREVELILVPEHGPAGTWTIDDVP